MDERIVAATVFAVWFEEETRSRKREGRCEKEQWW
jgi:hypothetical protein